MIYNDGIDTQDSRPLIFTEKGGTLVIVLVISSLLLVSSLWAISSYRKGVDATSDLMAKLDARFKAESVLQSFLYLGVTGKFTGGALVNGIPREVGFPGRIYLGGQSSKIRPANATEYDITLSCSDSSGLLNALYLEPRKFAKILRFAGIPLKQIIVINDSLKDWTDADDFHQLNGAEKWYYKQDRGFAYGPRNAPTLQSPWELSLLRGMTPEIMDLLLPNMALTSTGSYNIQTMNALMLAVFFDISLNQAEQLVTLREQDGNLNTIDIESISGRRIYSAGTENSTFPSRFLRVDLEVKAGDAVERWRGWIDFIPDIHGPYHILSWQEGMGV